MGYLFGQEQAYSEKYAPGANLNVRDENISVFRNALGLVCEKQVAVWHSKIKKTQVSEPAYPDEIRVFADLSWVYENYLNNNSYQAAFIGTSVYGTYNQQVPICNYGRVHAGFKGNYKNLDWKLSYTGLFAKKYIENSASIKFGFKF
jgi:hypothetical protein